MCLQFAPQWRCSAGICHVAQGPHGPLLILEDSPLPPALLSRCQGSPTVAIGADKTVPSAGPPAASLIRAQPLPLPGTLSTQGAKNRPLSFNDPLQGAGQQS